MQQRDFVGYGPNPPAVRWPNDARIAALTPRLCR